MIRQAFFLLIFLLGVTTPALATDVSWLEMRGIGTGFGVQVKESRTTPEELDKIKKTGFGFLRYGISWAKVEHEKGVYDWGPYDDFIKSVADRDLRSVIILGGGNPLYTKEIPAPKNDVDHRSKLLLPPTKPDEIAAFARFAAAAAERYKDQFILWEIWNEPDLARFWPPKPNAKAYAALAIQTCQAIKQADPDAKVMGPATASMPGNASLWDEAEFITPLLKSGAACLDAVSFHSYRIDEWHEVKIPETVIGDNQRVQEILTENLPAGQPIPALVNSEWGYTLTRGEPRDVAVTPEQQAAYVLRTRFANLLSGVPISIWYEWRDQQIDATADASDTEAHFGLMTIDKEAKPSLDALRAILPEIRQAKIERRLPTENKDHFLLSLIQPNGDYVLAFWTIRDPGETPDMIEIKRSFNNKRRPLKLQPQILEVGSSMPEVTIVKGAAAP